jgi:gliding motility-associated-like protein
MIPVIFLPFTHSLIIHLNQCTNGAQNGDFLILLTFFFEESYTFFENIPTYPLVSSTFGVDEYYVSTPNNYAGSQLPRTGLRYIGIRTETPMYLSPDGTYTNAPYFEYIQVQLNDSLEEGKSYEVSLFVSAAENNIFQNNSLGFLFSEDSISDFGISPVTADIVASDSAISIEDWVKITGNYTADGGEKFLTIGNLDLTVIDTFIIEDQFNSIYYYIDDVSVFENKRIDTTICPGDSITLTANPKSSSHLWPDGSTDSVFSINQIGTYWYKGNYDNIFHTDSFIVSYYEPLTISTTSDTTICHYESVELSVNNNTPDLQYNWSTGDTTSSIIVSEEGQYTISIKNLCEKVSDFIVVNKIPEIEFELGNDTTLCPNESILLNPQLNQGEYSWQDNSSDFTYTIASQGIYWLTVSNDCESISDTIDVKIYDQLNLDLGSDLKVCEFPITISVNNNNQVQYLWHDGSDKNYISIEDSSTVWVNVFNECESLFDTISVEQFCGCKLYIPSAFTPNKDQINEYFDIIETPNCILHNYELTIYNRWGQQVFQSEDISKSWDGKYKNQIVQDGIYLYSVYFKFAEKPLKRILGKVLLKK